MNRSTTLSARQQEMLELLSEGASTRVLARKMGYSEGTVRVYLHNLYRVLGVGNRTEAVLWQLRRAQPPAAAAPVAAPAAPICVPADESFGEVAVREGLLGALGVMESFIGPYGRLWAVGLRLKGAQIDALTDARRNLARTLWRALLAGRFEHAKRLNDEGVGLQLVADAPSEAVLMAAVLQIGGYSHASDVLAAELLRKRKPGRGVSAREASLLTSVRDAMRELDDEDALAGLYHLAAEARGNAAFRQTAIAALYYAYLARKDAQRARGTADALWAEAEASRRQLEAMGVRPLERDSALPRPGRAVARTAAPAREKAAVER